MHENKNIICSNFGADCNIPRRIMPSFTGEFVAIMLATMAVAFGSLLGGGSGTAISDVSTGVATIGLAVVLSNALAREILELGDRFGVAALWAVLLLF